MAFDASAPYNATNIFARILRAELPCRKVYEDGFALAFHDINPQAPVHVLIIPKTPHVSLAEFTVNAPAAEIAGFFQAVGAVARQLGLEQDGYRILANTGAHAHPEVPHFHVHLFGGRPLGPMLVKY
jgi:diadenosine tetraphosphate (Ap4A) HIT family hydrolase